MGLCASGDGQDPAAKKRSKDLDRQLKSDRQASVGTHKILFLGAGESGKSTLFKQMQICYGKGFSEEERKATRNHIYHNVVHNMKTMLAVLDTPGIGKPVADDLEASREFVLGLADSTNLYEDNVIDHFEALWSDDGVQMAFENRSKYQLDDSTEWFMNKLAEIGKEDWVPSVDDLLHSRVRTTGIIEKHFIIDGNDFQMFDVGGQRNERKKWIHCFEGVTAVLFVAAASGYDLMLYEDEKENRMDEALSLFDEVLSSRWFKKTHFILFLNKLDLLAEKIKKVPITTWADDFAGNPNDLEEVQEYLQERFQSLNKDSESRTIYTHFTNATNSENFRHVFEAVRNIVISTSLAEGGLL